MRKPIVIQEDTSTCFGCSQRNERGLQMQFFQIDDDEVECEIDVGHGLNGAPDVIHGGIQATMLDEAMGKACYAILQEHNYVTAELALRYRRPVPTNVTVRVRARVLQAVLPDIHLEGEIIDSEGEVLTTGTSRYKVVEWGRP